MKRYLIAASLVLGLAGTFLLANEPKLTDDVKCPISGKAINPDGVAEFNGGKVFFCCTNCPKSFEKNTAKFAAKANHQLAQTEQIEQTSCPITGRELNAETAIDVNGVSVAFCCEKCQAKVAGAEADKQVELAFGAEAKGWAPKAEAKTEAKAEAKAEE